MFFVVFKPFKSYKYIFEQQIYGAPNRRRLSDIDILVDKCDVRFLENELKKLRFKQQAPEDSNEARRNRVLCMVYSHQIPSYHKVVMGFHLNVDVNYDIFWGEYEEKHCSIEDFLSDSRYGNTRYYCQDISYREGVCSASPTSLQRNEFAVSPD